MQLIDGTRHYQKMKKSLGNKRNELGDHHITELVKLYGDNKHNAKSATGADAKGEKRICSKIFDNRDFGFLKITVERPLRLNFEINAGRIERLKQHSAFANLATSKKTKKTQAAAAEIAAGEQQQQAILDLLASFASDARYTNTNRDAFEAVLDKALKQADIKIGGSLRKAMLVALSERDPQADICTDGRIHKGGHPEPDADLRDTEIVPLPTNIKLPLPLGYDNETGHDKLLKLVKGHCDEYLKREVLPHVPDVWIDHSKTKVGYEIPLNRHFYVYQPPRALGEIEADIKALESEIMVMLSEVV